VDRSEALDRLPASYAQALKLKEAGADDALIALFLDIDVDAVDPLIAVGEAKLATLQRAPID
jgi:DNA-directed RNA polymerase specialized sigma24 family protein